MIYGNTLSEEASLHHIVHIVTFCMCSPWGSSAPVTTTTAPPDDFTFSLGESTDDGGAFMNQDNPFNLSDLSSTLPPSLMPDNTASSSNEVGGLYIENF